MLSIVRLFAAIIWAVVGLLLWVPMIVRAFAMQTGMLLYSAVTDTDTEKYDAWFSRVLSFYPNGFSRILGGGSLSGEITEDEVKIGRALFEVFFALLFYALTVFAYLQMFSPAARSAFPFGINSEWFSSLPPVEIVYNNAAVVEDYQTNRFLADPIPNRTEFRVLRVYAPNEESSRIQLGFRLCNLGQYNESLEFYAYFTDTARRTFRWNRIESPSIEPGACFEGELSPNASLAWSEMNFRSGQFNFRYGSVTTSIRVSE